MMNFSGNILRKNSHRYSSERITNEMKVAEKNAHSIKLHRFRTMKIVKVRREREKDFSDDFFFTCLGVKNYFKLINKIVEI